MSHELKINKRFESPAERVYDAWTKPELFSQWMGPSSVTCIKFDSDLRVGGEYEIHMQTDDGIKIAYGVYKTVDPNQALAFTWRWKDNDMPETLVSITFTTISSGTELRLHHTLLPSEDSADHHALGWNSSIEKLEAFLVGN